MKWQPDIFMVEAKAAGAPLIYELRARGIPVQEYNPTRGTKLAPNDKISRVNAISDIFASGLVWAPEFVWADEVIEDCANFPSVEHDDLVDCVAMALMRFRQGGFLTLASDSWDDDEPVRPRRRAYY
jgi:predicted phage terminase large subunit-like protein